jgi:lysophospholipase L1-like esterase
VIIQKTGRFEDTIMKKDYRAKPVQKIVVIGESNAFGMCATDPRNEWVQTASNLIRDFEDESLAVFNNSIPANVISPHSPGFAHLPDWGKPSALERYKEDLIMQSPDIAIIAYGLNDSRSGYQVDSFLQDLEHIVSDTVKETKALVVLTSPYWNTQYDEGMWNSLDPKPDWIDEWKDFTVSGRDLVWSYVMGIEKVAREYTCLFVDLFSPTEGCTWLLHDDHVHFNDVGQRLIGQIVFNAIACNCSFIGKKSQRIAEGGKFDITNTGGTQGMSRMIRDWLKR